MGEKKVTIMVLKADLQCSKCYKKVKKVLCKYPQIRDQVFDEKTNTVRIKVVCCSPEKIRDKLCCKGEGSIKSIEILEPEKPKPPPEKKPEKPKEPEKKPEKPKEPEKKPEKPKEPEKKPEKPKEAEKKPEKPTEPEKKPEKPKEQDKPKEPEKPAEPKPEKPKVTFVEPPKALLSPEPVPGYPSVPSIGMCCRECYGGHAGGPCCQPGYEQVRYYDGYYGRPVYDSWGGGGCDNRVYRSRCTDYICEENPAAPCSIM